MQVVRRGGAAFRPIIKDHPVGTKISQELKEGLDMVVNGLKAMVYVGDGEVRRKDRHGIAEDQVIALVEDPFLNFWEMILAEETLPLPCLLFAYFGCTTVDSARIILKADGKSLTG